MKHVYIMDRGYVDFLFLYRFSIAADFFITRAKSNTQIHRVYSQPVDKEMSLICD